MSIRRSVGGLRSTDAVRAGCRVATEGLGESVAHEHKLHVVTGSLWPQFMGAAGSELSSSHGAAEGNPAQTCADGRLIALSPRRQCLSDRSLQAS